jgi:hypothetical protein
MYEEYERGDLYIVREDDWMTIRIKYVEALHNSYSSIFECEGMLVAVDVKVWRERSDRLDALLFHPFGPIDLTAEVFMTLATLSCLERWFCGDEIDWALSTVFNVLRVSEELGLERISRDCRGFLVNELRRHAENPFFILNLMIEQGLEMSIIVSILRASGPFFCYASDRISAEFRIPLFVYIPYCLALNGDEL